MTYLSRCDNGAELWLGSLVSNGDHSAALPAFRSSEAFLGETLVSFVVKHSAEEQRLLNKFNMGVVKVMISTENYMSYLF